MRGVVLKSLWFLFVFVVSVVVQVVFMDAAKANGSGDFRGRTDAREYSFMGIRERTEDIRTTI